EACTWPRPVAQSARTVGEIGSGRSPTWNSDRNIGPSSVIAAVCRPLAEAIGTLGGAAGCTAAVGGKLARNLLVSGTALATATCSGAAVAGVSPANAMALRAALEFAA